MKRSTLSITCLVLLVPAWGWTSALLPFSDGFETYTNGSSLAAMGTNGWGGTGGVSVQTNAAFASEGTNFVWLSEGAMLSNSVNAAGQQKIWTDCRIKPVKGYAPIGADSTASVQLYFDTDGYLNLRTASGWEVCSNDFRGAAVLPVTSQWARVTIRNDYQATNAAVFLDSHLLRQLVPFSGSSSAYTGVGWSNRLDDTYLDNVSIRTNYPPDISDAAELQQYGYCHLILNVGVGQSFPAITNALAVARDRDVISVSAGSYTGDLDVATAVILTGTMFTVQGAMTIESGLSVTSLVSVTFSSNVTVNAGATLVVSGASLTCTNLVIVSGGMIQVANGSVTANGMTLNGTFTLRGSVGGIVVPSEIPFSDTFECYPDGAPLNALGAFGWAASANVSNQVAEHHLGSKAVHLPDGSVLSNTFAAAGQSKMLWTDCWIKPVLGYAPTAPARAAASLKMYFTEDGYLAVSTNGAWDVCTNVTAVVAGGWVRLTLHHDYDKHLAAVFVNNELARADLPFDSSINAYSWIMVTNKLDDAYLDDIAVGTVLPSGLSQADTDHDGTPDVQEIHLFGSLWVVQGVGSVFKIR